MLKCFGTFFIVFFSPNHVLLALPREAAKKERPMLKKLGIIVIATLIAILLYISPIFKPFPLPTGPFEVGTTSIELMDQSRKGLYTDNPDEPRTIVVRFFYPTDNIQNRKTYPYFGQKRPYFQKLIAEHFGIPAILSKLFLRNITTHSYIDAPLSEKYSSYPIVVFSHGGLSLPSDTYIALLENLASHGYIVAALDHPYLNAITLYKSGKVVSSQKLTERFNAMSHQEQKLFLQKMIGVYKADLAFVIDELTKLNDDRRSIFYKHIDLNHIAAMGHSAGGTAAIEFCRTDKLCKAAIDLDGWYDHVIGQEPLHKPLLLMFGSKSLEITEPTAEYLKRKKLTREQYYEREKKIAEHMKTLCSNPTCSFVVIPAATHNDFSDEIFIKWPLRPGNAIDPYKTIATINDYVVQFLHKYLKAS